MHGESLAPELAAPLVDTATALERIYGRHCDDVYRIALRYGGGRREWAEDVVQDVFLVLAGKLASLDDHDALMGWLYRTTTRRCLNRLESERFRELFPQWLQHLGLHEPSQPDAIVAARGEVDRALAALAKLPPKERVAFAMYRLDERPVLEIARTIGHSKGYVSKLITRAEARLAKVLR